MHHRGCLSAAEYHSLDQPGKAKYFSTVGLASGYYQIQLAEKDCEKTTFSTQLCHFEFPHLPTGVKSAPSTVQCLMYSVLAGMNGLRYVLLFE
jgi:hypothetical protein